MFLAISYNNETSGTRLPGYQVSPLLLRVRIGLACMHNPALITFVATLPEFSIIPLLSLENYRFYPNALSCRTFVLWERWHSRNYE